MAPPCGTGYSSGVFGFGSADDPPESPEDAPKAENKGKPRREWARYRGWTPGAI
jgi:hypothetical protein